MALIHQDMSEPMNQATAKIPSERQAWKTARSANEPHLGNTAAVTSKPKNATTTSFASESQACKTAWSSNEPRELNTACGMSEPVLCENHVPPEC